MAQIVLVHGVGGMKPAADWLGPLNDRLAGLGYPRIGEPSDTVRVVDYQPSFKVTASDPLKVTYVRPDERERKRLQIEYAVRQREIQRLAHRYSEDRWMFSLDMLPDWMRNAGAFLADQHAPFFREVKWFVKSKAIRNAACRLVHDVFPRSGSVILVAHSLGSVVAARALRMLPPGVTVDMFVTVGSPLSFGRYRDRVEDLWDDFPWGRVRGWLNVYSPRDWVCAGRGITPAVDEAVDACARVDGSHDVRAYMSHPAVAAVIGDALFGDRREARPERNVPSRRIDPYWFSALLNTAYTFQMAEAWKSDRWDAYLRLNHARREVARRITEIIQDAQADHAQVTADGPLAPGRHPTLHDLTDSAAPLLRDTKVQDEGLLVLAVTLLSSPLVQPFDFEKWVKESDRRTALELTFNVVRDHGRGNLADARFAKQVVESLEWGRDRLKDGAGFPWGPVLIGVGLAALAATGIGLAVAAPAGLAGAAAITSTLAAFGPGGMVGGVATLAALTGTAGVLTTIGVTEELSDGNARETTGMRAGHVVLANLDPEQLASTLAGMLAVVHAQSKLGFATTEPETRDALSTALADVTAEYQLHHAVAPDTRGTKRYGRRIQLLLRALDALDRLDLPHVKMHVALRDAVRDVEQPENPQRLLAGNELNAARRDRELPSADNEAAS